MLAAYEPLGVVPGQPYDPAKVAKIDGAKVPRGLRTDLRRRDGQDLGRGVRPRKELFGKFKPKGQMPLELLLFQSVLGPIGLPAPRRSIPASPPRTASR
jgi:hypothetical protein